MLTGSLHIQQFICRVEITYAATIRTAEFSRRELHLQLHGCGDVHLSKSPVDADFHCRSIRILLQMCYIISPKLLFTIEETLYNIYSYLFLH